VAEVKAATWLPVIVNGDVVDDVFRSRGFEAVGRPMP